MHFEAISDMSTLTRLDLGWEVRQNRSMGKRRLNLGNLARLHDICTTCRIQLDVKTLVYIVGYNNLGRTFSSPFWRMAQASMLGDVDSRSSVTFALYLVALLIFIK
jgi:hypothetical protein